MSPPSPLPLVSTPILPLQWTCIAFGAAGSRWRWHHLHCSTLQHWVWTKTCQPAANYPVSLSPRLSVYPPPPCQLEEEGEHSFVPRQVVTQWPIATLWPPSRYKHAGFSTHIATSHMWTAEEGTQTEINPFCFTRAVYSTHRDGEKAAAPSLSSKSMLHSAACCHWVQQFTSHWQCFPVRW